MQLNMHQSDIKLVTLHVLNLSTNILGEKYSYI